MNINEILELIEAGLEGMTPGPWVFHPDTMRAIIAHIRELEARSERAEAANKRLRIALQPFSTFGRHNTDERGWSGLRCENERIRVWFGPADFRAALAAMEAADEQ